MKLKHILLIALIAFVASVGGVAVGRYFLPAAPQPGAELHALLHNGLDLDAGQQAQLDQLERQFGLRKKALEMALRADNARLAAAIEAEHSAGPRVREAVDRIHVAMGELQKETLAHVFAMRAILRPDQAAKFDQAVVKALTAESR
ncbi:MULTISPECIES: periplasmic heavy metal sensor [unclassified Sphingomonas]|uniref:periplasmic heavy metal sensor n=1 Tax=unclassified Sphingomonas TaxID=196159 RepID=UPI000835AD20|nr:MULTISPECIES: periplasmic heavy metal sensor [unclassified Sphingomonas]MBX3595242.1 periplasmic heavy metal sensor [Sphingomonas sp.]